jgi:hypothetical protein
VQTALSSSKAVFVASSNHGGKLTMPRKLPKMAITSQSIAVQLALSSQGVETARGRHLVDTPP